MITGQEIHENLRQRFDTAFLNGQRWFTQLLDVVRYAVPSMDGLNVLYQYDDTGQFLEYYVYNNVPQIAADKRASDLHSLLLPVGRKWGEIYTDGVHNNQASDDFARALQKSNIHSVAHSLFLDLTIGTAGIWIDSPSKDEPLVFKNLTGVAILPEYDDTANPKNVWFRKIVNDMDVKQYTELPENYQSSQNKNYVTCGFIYNRTLDGEQIYDVDNGDKFEWLYVEILEDIWEKPLVFEARRFKQLHLINDTVRAGDARGRGVALKLLNDIVYLNDLSKALKEGVQLKAQPPLLANPALGNFNFSNLSGGILPSTLATDGVPLLQPMEWNFDVPAVQELVQQLELRIQSAFNVDPFGDAQTAPVRTATEVSARQAEAQRQSLTDISRIVYDFTSVLDTCLSILRSRGLIAKGQHSVEFRNPTLQQEANVELNALLQYRQMTDQIIDPNWSNLANSAIEIDAYIKKKLLIPQDLSNSPQQIQQATGELQNMVQQNPQLAQPTNQSTALQAAQLGQLSNVKGVGQ